MLVFECPFIIWALSSKPLLPQLSCPVFASPTLWGCWKLLKNHFPFSSNLLFISVSSFTIRISKSLRGKSEMQKAGPPSMSISFWSSLSFDSFGWSSMLWSKFFNFCISSCSQQESEMSLLLGSFSWLEVEIPERTGGDTFVRWFLLLIFLLRDFFIQWNVLCLVPQSCPTPCDPRDCSPPGFSAHGDSPGKNTGVGYYTLLYSILAWVAISSSKGSSWIRNWTCISYISCTGGYILYQWCRLASPINVNHIGIIYQIILKEEWIISIWLSIQFTSVTQSCLTLCNPMDSSTPASLSVTDSWSLVKLMSIEWVMPSNHLILCRPLLLLHSIFPSIRVFPNESGLPIRWPKYWNFSFCISPSNEHSGLISFRMDWLDVLAVQGTLKSPWVRRFQKHQFFGTQLSLWSNSHSHTWLLEKPQIWLDGPLLTK